MQFLPFSDLMRCIVDFVVITDRKRSWWSFAGAFNVQTDRLFLQAIVDRNENKSLLHAEKEIITDSLLILPSAATVLDDARQIIDRVHSAEWSNVKLRNHWTSPQTRKIAKLFNLMNLKANANPYLCIDFIELEEKRRKNTILSSR